MFNLKKMRKNKKGFTLIELIVVIAILGILAAVMIPKIGGFTEKARMAADETWGAELASAGAMYAAAHNVASFASSDATIAAIATDKLIDTAITTITLAEGKLTSTTYKGINITYDGNNVTLKLTDTAGGGGTTKKTITK